MLQANKQNLIKNKSAGDKVDKKEKLLLLDLILQDIRGNWGFDLQNRIAEAYMLAKDLNLNQFIDSINEYKELCEAGDDDGRFFRTTYDDGGYMGMSEVHKLPYKISGRSTEFKDKAEEILTYPEARFKDWGKQNE